MMTRFSTRLLAALASAGFLTLSAAAQAQHTHSHDHAPAVSALGQPGKATAKTRTVTVEMTDNLYNLDQIEVMAGETIRFVVINKGDFLHEFNIGTRTIHAEHQKMMAMMVDHGMLTATKLVSMDHSAMPGMKHDDPNSVLVEPGQTKELVWTFPKGGTLEFACNMPGHYEAGMVGKIQFKK